MPPTETESAELTREEFFVEDLEPEDPERVCHLVATFPRAVCGYDLSGRTVHGEEECLRLGHPRCADCWKGPGGVDALDEALRRWSGAGGSPPSV